MNKLWLELKNNVRLRLALAVIGAILGWNALIDARASLDLARTAYRQAANQTARLSSTKDWAAWPARAKAAKTWVDKGEAQLWQSPSVGLAQANLQDWLVDSLARAKASQPAVSLVEEGGDVLGKKSSASSEGLPSDVVLVRFKVVFQGDGAMLQDLLDRWEDNDKPWRVESLAVHRTPAGFKSEALVSTAVLIRKDARAGVAK